MGWNKGKKGQSSEISQSSGDANHSIRPSAVNDKMVRKILKQGQELKYTQTTSTATHYKQKTWKN